MINACIYYIKKKIYNSTTNSAFLLVNRPTILHSKECYLLLFSPAPARQITRASQTREPDYNGVTVAREAGVTFLTE